MYRKLREGTNRKRGCLEKIVEYLEYMLGRLGKVELLPGLVTEWQSHRDFRVPHGVFMKAYTVKGRKGGNSS